MADLNELHAYVEVHPNGAQYVVSGDDLRALLADHKRLLSMHRVPADACAKIRDVAADMSVAPDAVLRAMVAMALREDRDQELVCEVEDVLRATRQKERA